MNKVKFTYPQNGEDFTVTGSGEADYHLGILPPAVH